jgi:hypothetical protein
MCVLAGLGVGGATIPSRAQDTIGFWFLREARAAHRQGEDRKAAMFEEMGFKGVDWHKFDGRLEFAEWLDFLATPALLVQEAVSDDVVLTYPEE